MLDAKQVAVHERRHPEWREHNLRWRWLLDTWEGGDAYRLASYGQDRYGFPLRNLIRHKREYPEARDVGSQFYTQSRWSGTDQSQFATDDDYSLRLARTPVPTLFSDVVEKHLSGVFSREIKRESSDVGIAEWWKNVDGKGTTIDEWMTEAVAPLLLMLGCVDIVADHPAAPGDATIETMADVKVNRLDACNVSHILPENMVWWRLDEKGTSYEECLVCEPQDDHSRVYRHWTSFGWTLYGETGKKLDEGEHPYGRVPIIRIFDRRRPRCRNVGLPRYEAIAEIQREYYNRDSELILSDTTQAHPLLQGPEDYVQADGSIPIGPSWLLPKKKNTQGGSASYEGFEVVDFPKDGADSIRQNLDRLVDLADRSACLTKPAGASGSTASTVSQSGVSKELDAVAGNRLLGKIASTLQRAETAIVGLVKVVLGDGKPTGRPDDTAIVYPRQFELMSAVDLAAAVGEFQAILGAAGECPETESMLLCRLVRLMAPGLEDDEYQEIDDEIEACLERKAAARDQANEGAAAMADVTANGPADNQPADGGSEPNESDDADESPGPTGRAIPSSATSARADGKVQRDSG